MKGYEFLPETEEEMNEAARFYERRKEGLGLEFLNEVERTVASILAHPRSGPAISPSIRRRIVRRFPFGVLYAVHIEQIVITFGPDGLGAIQIIAIGASIDYGMSERDGLPYVEFSWSGFDDDDPTCGRDSARLENGKLMGRFFIHQGDESSFVYEHA